jgi:subtilase family serine protease
MRTHPGLLGLAALAAVLAISVPTHTFAFNGQAAQHIRVCPNVPANAARCHAILVIPAASAPAYSGTGPLGGYGPQDLQAAYAVSTSSATVGAGRIVAIVDAYDDPNAESDLGVYRSQFGLPPADCKNADPCFRKVNQSGGTSYPAPDTGWAEEISLDLDMVSAICPRCNILLVEANSNSVSDLGTAENEAATLGATAISNSYGTSEFFFETSFDSSYNHPGIAITASSGDGGYGVEWPAASGYVTAVGGTTLTPDSNARGWTEKAWSGSGSGCSAFESKPKWQSIIPKRVCSRRSVADVSAVADPATPVSAYDTFNQSGWLLFGGTSVASPIIASMYALAGNAGSVTYGSYPYSHTSSLNDITSGSDGRCGSLLCTAGHGYDGPTGLGTPAGTGAF